LQALPQWINWCHEVVDGRNTKVPYSPHGAHRANIHSPSTWGSFQDALDAVEFRRMDGIGLVLTPNDPYTGIDIDNKPENPASPQDLEAQAKIYHAFNSYAELSPGGHGCHIIVRGKVLGGTDRGHVGIYSSDRYLTFTGKVLRNEPIREYQELLDILYAEMGVIAQGALVEMDETLPDDQLYNMAATAFNADKFNALWSGDIGGYPSQSEADFALLAILAFYTQSNEQVRRMFRYSALGQRDKATRNDKYLDTALGKVRAQQPPPLDLTQTKVNAMAILNQKENQHVTPSTHPHLSTDPGLQTGLPQTPEAPADPGPEEQPQAPAHQNPDRTGLPPTGAGEGNLARLNRLKNPLPSEHTAPPAGECCVPNIVLPPGLVGDLACYFYQTAIRPVPEVAVAAAIAFMGGICGRSFNISDTGLNQYIVLLAKTGSGKEGAASGI